MLPLVSIETLIPKINLKNSFHSTELLDGSRFDGRVVEIDYF